MFDQCIALQILMLLSDYAAFSFSSLQHIYFHIIDRACSTTHGHVMSIREVVLFHARYSDTQLLSVPLNDTSAI